VATRGDDGHWLRDSRRLVLACGNRLVLVDSVTGSSRDLLATVPTASLNAASAGTSAASRSTEQAWTATSGRWCCL